MFHLWKDFSSNLIRSLSPLRPQQPTTAFFVSFQLSRTFASYKLIVFNFLRRKDFAKLIHISNYYFWASLQVGFQWTLLPATICNLSLFILSIFIVIFSFIFSLSWASSPVGFQCKLLPAMICNLSLYSQFSHPCSFSISSLSFSSQLMNCQRIQTFH